MGFSGTINPALQEYTIAAWTERNLFSSHHIPAGCPIEIVPTFTVADLTGTIDFTLVQADKKVWIYSSDASVEIKQHNVTVSFTVRATDTGQTRTSSHWEGFFLMNIKSQCVGAIIDAVTTPDFQVESETGLAVKKVPWPNNSVGTWRND